MTVTMIRSLIEQFPTIDPHELATSYVNHVMAAHATGRDPMPVSAAVLRFAKTGSI